MSADGTIDWAVIELTGLDVGAWGGRPVGPGLGDGSGAGNGSGLGAAGADPQAAADGPPKVDLDAPDLDERERDIAALEEAGWVQAKGARPLDMTPRQIAYRIQTLNIKVRQF